MKRPRQCHLRPSQFLFLNTRPEGAGVAVAFLAAATLAAFLAAVVEAVAVFFTAFGLTVPVVLPLATIFGFALVAVAVVFFAGTAVFFLRVAPRAGLVMTVAFAEEATLRSDAFDRRDACDALRCGDRFGIELAVTLVRVARAGRGGGSIFPLGDAGTGIEVPVIAK